MNKTLKRILLALGILIVAFVPIFVVFMLKAKSETKTMAPVETMQVVDNVFSIKDGYSNLYLIKDSDQYIAIDGGNDVDAIAVELKKLSIDPDKVVAVLLTHSDADHVAAIELFKNAKTYLSTQEEQLINGTKSRFFFFSNKIDAKDYTLVADQQVINIGDLTVKGILTPGHTLGSMCYLINDKYLFTGDLLSIKGGKIGKFNELFNMDTKTAVQSTAIITQLPNCEYIFSAHYGYTNDYKNAVKDWVK